MFPFYINVGWKYSSSREQAFGSIFEDPKEQYKKLVTENKNAYEINYCVLISGKNTG